MPGTTTSPTSPPTSPATKNKKEEAPILWRHPDPSRTNLARFMRHVSLRHPDHIPFNYPTLYEWSVTDVAAFWAEVWEFCGVRASRGYDHVLPPWPPAGGTEEKGGEEETVVGNGNGNSNGNGNGHGNGHRPKGGVGHHTNGSKTTPPMFPRPDFFQGARLNFAENLLFPVVGETKEEVDEAAVAIFTATERDADLRQTTWAQLREDVRRCANALRAFGLKKDDVVAGFVSNHVESVVAMLAATALGAVWTGISPDNGVSAVLDRLVQIAPRVLFADNGVVYNGKEWPGSGKTAEVVAGLADKGLGLVVVVRNLAAADAATGEIKAKGKGKVGRVEEWDAFLQGGSDASQPLVFEQLPPSHPVYILYSSGTTGLPKAIVHTAAGTLLQHKKELYLHCSMSPRSRMLYYTTTSWMMWHWSVSALAVGASLVLYSGSPFRPHGHLSLPRLLSRLQVTHFGTSAAYLVTLESNDVRPVDDRSLDLSRLEAIYSTASPLPPSTFAFVYDAFPPRVNLASITGGTDIISLFGAPCPLLPVRAGEIQCAGLGMAVRVVDSASPEGGDGDGDGDGAPRPVDPPGAPGDLVCVKPFPCQPLTFWGPGGDEKYRAAYFERFPGIWTHGDFVSMNATGGLTMLGRSDGVLKPSGVRFGSAEIYNVLTRFFASTIADAVCVGRRRPDVDKDEAVLLFVVMRTPEDSPSSPPSTTTSSTASTTSASTNGTTTTTDEKAPRLFVKGVTDEQIKQVIRRELSPRHVPAVVAECGPEGVPRTGNGKKIEVAVKAIVSGLPVKTNASVANPGALEWFRGWAERN